MTDYIQQGFQDLLDGNLVKCNLAEIEAALADEIAQGNLLGELQCLLLRGRQLLRDELKAEAKEDYLRADRIGRELGLEDRYEDIIEWSLGFIGHATAQLEESLEHSKKALVLSRAIGRKVSEYGALLGIAVVYYSHGALTSAIAYCREAAALTKGTNLQSGYVRSLLMLADILLIRHDFEAALPAAIEVMEATTALGDVTFKSHAYLKLVSSFIGLGEIEKAAAAVEELVELRKGLPETFLNSSICFLQAQIAFENGDIKTTLRQTQQAVEIQRRLGNAAMLVNALSLHGQNLLRDKQYAAALEVLLEARAIAKEHDEALSVRETMEYLAETYAAIGDYKKAYEFGEEQRLAEKRLAAEDADSQLRILRIENEVERRELEKEKLRMKAKLLEQDLTSATLTLLAQTELLSDFRDSLREIVRRIPPTEPAIRELKEKLKELPCTSVDWQKFETQFATVHPEFKLNLLTKYPSLSSAETRMCILIRLGLKTLEISRLTCLSERSVEDHRYNIRKKLGLARGENVPDYLARIV